MSEFWCLRWNRWLGIVDLIIPIQIGDVGLNSRGSRFAGQAICQLCIPVRGCYEYHGSGEGRKGNRGEEEEREKSGRREGEEREKRGQEQHTFAKDNFFPLTKVLRVDWTNSNNPPVDPFPVESNEIEADERSGAKAWQLKFNSNSNEYVNCN